MYSEAYKSTKYKYKGDFLLFRHVMINVLLLFDISCSLGLSYIFLPVCLNWTDEPWFWPFLDLSPQSFSYRWTIESNLRHYGHVCGSINDGNRLRVTQSWFTLILQCDPRVVTICHVTSYFCHFFFFFAHLCAGATFSVEVEVKVEVV